MARRIAPNAGLSAPREHHKDVSHRHSNQGEKRKPSPTDFGAFQLEPHVLMPTAAQRERFCVLPGGDHIDRAGHVQPTFFGIVRGNHSRETLAWEHWLRAGSRKSRAPLRAARMQACCAGGRPMLHEVNRAWLSRPFSRLRRTPPLERMRPSCRTVRMAEPLPTAPEGPRPASEGHDAPQTQACALLGRSDAPWGEASAASTAWSSISSSKATWAPFCLAGARPMCWTSGPWRQVNCAPCFSAPRRVPSGTSPPSGAWGRSQTGD